MRNKLREFLRRIGSAAMLFSSMALATTGIGEAASVIPTTAQTQAAVMAREKALMLNEVRRRVPVAIIGGDSLEIEINAATAASAGLLPRYLSVIAPVKRYAFSPFAQVVRSGQNLAVSSFGLLYVFPIQSVRLYYMGFDDDIPIASLPSVSLFEAQSGPIPGIQGAASRWPRICPDCVELSHETARVAQLEQSWEGLKDPWQTTSTFMKVFNGSADRTGGARSGNIHANSCFGSGGGSGCPWPSVGSSPSIGSSGPGQGPPGRPKAYTYVAMCAGTVGGPAGTNVPLVAHSYTDSFSFTVPTESFPPYGTNYLQAGPNTLNPLIWRLVKVPASTYVQHFTGCIIVDERPGSWYALESVASNYTNSDWPSYGVLTRNCNTWTDASLLAIGQTVPAINFDFYALWKISGLFPLGYSYGPDIVNLFV